MATAHPPPAPAAVPHPGAAPAERAAGDEAVQALVPAPASQRDEGEPIFRAPLVHLPVALGVTIPIREFRVRQLLVLAPGQVIETQWSHGDDLPLAAGDVQVAWAEFEVIETQLAVRVTRLA